jgi:hypothetical protein
VTIPHTFEHHQAPERSSTSLIAPEDIENAAGRAAYAYWRMLRGGRKLPARAELSPRDMKGFLRNVVLLRVIDGGRDYEYRIVGELFVWAYGVQFRDKFLTQIEAAAPEHGARMRNLYEHVRTNAEPLALRGWVGREIADSRFVYHESVLLPLGSDGDTVDHILVASFYVPKAAG